MCTEQAQSRQHSRQHYESVLAGAYRRVTDGAASGTDASASGKRLGLGTGSQSVSQTLLDGNGDQYLESVRPVHHLQLSRHMYSSETSEWDQRDAPSAFTLQ